MERTTKSRTPLADCQGRCCAKWPVNDALSHAVALNLLHARQPKTDSTEHLIVWKKVDEMSNPPEDQAARLAYLQAELNVFQEDLARVHADSAKRRAEAEYIRQETRRITAETRRIIAAIKRKPIH